jgi:transcriptional regulator with XRE-family HTH domain
MSVFSDRLRQLRGAQNQSAFASRLGIKPGAYGHYETGIREPSIDMILQIVEATGVSADWLFGLSDKETSRAGDAKRITELEGRLAEANQALDIILKSASKVRGK